RQGAVADDGIRGVGVHVEHRRIVEVDPDRAQFGGQRTCKPDGKRIVAASPQRDRRWPPGARPAEARDTAALLIDADPERPGRLDGTSLPREVRNLFGGVDVAGEVDHATEIERSDEPSQPVRHVMALEADNRKATHLAPEIPK